MQIPGPGTKVVELRVHGVLGTSGSKLTDSVASVDVAGDGVGRIVRPADRLRRPVPGSALTAGDRTVPRITEGYVWGGMTSGGFTKASWALLFPFALANMAHWMLPPAPDTPTGRALLGVSRALLRLAALLLTMLLVAQLAVISLDLLAAQCLAGQSACLTFLPDFLRDLPWLRQGVALLPVGLVVLCMHRLSSAAWHVSVPKQDSPHAEPRAPMLPGAAVVSDPDTPTLRALHATAALSIVVVMALGGPLTVSTDPRWLLAMALVLGCVIAAVGLKDPNGLYGSSWNRAWRLLFTRSCRRGFLVLAGVLFISPLFTAGPSAGPLVGSGHTIDVLTVALLLTCAALAIVLVPAARWARPGWQHLPRRLRPWAGGWMAAPILMIACMLGTGFGAGLAQTVRQLLGPSALTLPDAYRGVTVFWGGSAVLLAAALIVLAPVALVRHHLRHRDEHVPDEVALLHAGKQEDQPSAAKAWWRADLQQRHGHRLLLVLAGVLVVSTLLSLLLRGPGSDLAWWSERLSAIGIVVLAALAGALLRMVQQAAKERDTARFLGVLCDLTLFWPRQAHPVVPPCYGLKVVPELAARATEHLADPDVRVVLVGHSQGSLLAAVATARLLETLPEADRERVGLVTAGSQLQWAYPRAFPAVIAHHALRELSDGLAGRWRALCRGTDPLGGGVTTWSRQVFGGKLLGVGFRGNGTVGPLAAATRGPTGALVLGGDHWLPDPQRGPFSCRRWVPGVLGHGDYPGDPEWDRAVAMAAGLEIPARASTLPVRAPLGAPIPARPDGASRATGGDGESMPEPEWATADTASATENGGTAVRRESSTTTRLDREKEVGERWQEAERQEAQARKALAEPPELPESDDRTAPWERGFETQ